MEENSDKLKVINFRIKKTIKRQLRYFQEGI